jgi:hypothetical protein
VLPIDTPDDPLRCQPTGMASRLCWSEITTIAKNRDEITRNRIAQLGV